MTAVTRLQLGTFALALVAAASIAGCTSQAEDSPKPAESNAQPSPAEGKDASAILDAALSSAQPLARGAGPLETSIGNTLASKPSAGSVSFVFACSGTGKVSLRFRDAGREIPSASGDHACGDTVFERILPVTSSSALSFDGSVQASATGKFAYAYLQEVKTAPSPTSSS